jgi:hypothetical protein
MARLKSTQELAPGRRFTPKWGLFLDSTLLTVTDTFRNLRHLIQVNDMTEAAKMVAYTDEAWEDWLDKALVQGNDKEVPA